MQTFESIPEVIDSYPRRFKPEKAEGVEGVVQMHFTGDGGGHYFMVIEDQTVTVQEGTYDHPTMSVTAPAEAWLALNNGEAGPMALLMQGKLKFSGSMPMALKFRSLFETAV